MFEIRQGNSTTKLDVTIIPNPTQILGGYESNQKGFCIINNNNNCCPLHQLDIQIDAQSKSGKFEDEIKQEQEQRKKEDEEKKQKRAEFKDKATFFANQTF